MSTGKTCNTLLNLKTRSLEDGKVRLPFGLVSRQHAFISQLGMHVWLKNPREIMTCDVNAILRRDTELVPAMFFYVTF